MLYSLKLKLILIIIKPLRALRQLLKAIDYKLIDLADKLTDNLYK